MGNNETTSNEVKVAPDQLHHRQCAEDAPHMDLLESQSQNCKPFSSQHSRMPFAGDPQVDGQISRLQNTSDAGQGCQTFQGSTNQPGYTGPPPMPQSTADVLEILQQALKSRDDRISSLQAENKALLDNQMAAEAIMDLQRTKAAIQEELDRKCRDYNELLHRVNALSNENAELKRESQQAAAAAAAAARISMARKKVIHCVVALRKVDSDDFKLAVHSFLGLVGEELQRHGEVTLQTSTVEDAPLGSLAHGTVLVVPCLSSSRLATDVDGVVRHWNLRSEHGGRAIVLLIFHHQSERSSSNRLGLTPSTSVLSSTLPYVREMVDVMFWRSQGVYSSEHNTRAVSQLVSFLKPLVFEQNCGTTGTL